MFFVRFLRFLSFEFCKIAVRLQKKVIPRAKHNHTEIVLKLVRFVIGVHWSDVDDAIAVKYLKQLESICTTYNILPIQFSRDPKATQSKLTITKSILYSSLMAVNIIHLILLSSFDLPVEWHHLLGDFFHGHPNGRFFWLFFLNGSIFGEALRRVWIYLARDGHSTSFKFELIYSKGFKSQLLCMDQFYCRKLRFFVTNLAIFWVRIIFCATISFAPILIFIFHSVSQLPQTLEQYIFSGFWLIITYLGFVWVMTNAILIGSLITIKLCYFYFKVAHVARTVQNLALKRLQSNNASYLLDYKATVREIIRYQNEIEQVNVGIRNLFIVAYLGISFVDNFGIYAAVFVHIDRGLMDFFIVNIVMIGFVVIGVCSYTNGVMLSKMHSCCKNLRKATRHLQLNVQAFIKVTDLEDRLSRTDIAFTIGKILNLTTRVFVIYLIENICLIMMFKVNLRN
uniref:Gustatory receptor n=1 Tax=Tetranychus urticae TaxID=32264 RepID=T1KG42_TETUR